jgi:hypothetical protein
MVNNILEQAKNSSPKTDTLPSFEFGNLFNWSTDVKGLYY